MHQVYSIRGGACMVPREREDISSPGENHAGFGRHVTNDTMKNHGITRPKNEKLKPAFRCSLLSTLDTGS